MIPAVNFHLCEPCNMRCKFCFATFQDVKHSILPKGHLPKEQAIEVVLQLAEIGFEKITFAGGEPTLCPWLPDLIATAKQAGLTTMIVTNGSKLSDSFLQKNRQHLDWIAISVDSLDPNTNLETGRAISGKTVLTSDFYFSLAERIKQHGYGLKVNTVVSSKNFNENMSEFIRYANPLRWKVLQALPIIGQNDTKIEDFKISTEQFQFYLDCHANLKDITNIIPESNEQMKGSYAMVDPAGRFYDNAQGKHNYSRPILEIGARLAIQQVNYDFDKFILRGGIYRWAKQKTLPKRITISGEVGSGKSTIGKLLAQKLNYKFVSLGNKTREFANSHGKSIVEFQRECLSNPKIDKQIDQQFSEECNATENLIIDYRLGFKFISNAFHIYLKISENTATERLKNDNRTNETHLTIGERNLTFKNQFLNAYQIEYTADENYNLVIDVEDFESPEKLADYILDKLI